MTHETCDAAVRQMDLSGPWHLRLDRLDEGEEQSWPSTDFSEDPSCLQLTLPGSLQHQGLGDDITLETPWTGLVVDRSYFTEDRYRPYREEGHIQVPFWLQPEKYYKGSAWLQRKITLPPDWAGKPLVLELERAHWETTFWVDGRRIGTERSLTTPHRFSVGELATGSHLLTVRTDNRMIVNVGPNAHSVSDHTQGNWNGIIGKLVLHRSSEVVISGVSVVPDIASRTVRAKIDLAAGSQGLGKGTITVRVSRYNVPGSHRPSPVSSEFDFDYPDGLGSRGLTSTTGHVDLQIPLGEAAETWDEFHPALYELHADLVTEVNGTTYTHAYRTSFGLREVNVQKTWITVNGRRTFIRGTLESCVFPLTGYPPTDVPSWRCIIRVCKAHGLNLLRFHSWCPPEAAFTAADELGFYFQVEGPVWANQGTSLGEGADVDAFLYQESARIIAAYGNHPSFLMMAHGNEPSGRDAEYLAEWVQYWRKRDPRRLYTSGAGWPSLDENDYDNVPEPRIQRWGEGLASRINALPPETTTDYSKWVQSRPRPLISHEIGQWCAYPNFSEAEKYTGLMKPKNFGIFADFLATAGMEDQAHDFLMASGKLQSICYKEEIEAALRTPGFAGFHLLGLTDFPGQGTAPVGVLDAFWEEKGYITAKDFSRFCGPIAPLVRLPKRVWQANEALAAEVQVANFGPKSFYAEIHWKLAEESGRVLATGSLPRSEVALGNELSYGTISARLDGLTTAQRLQLIVTVADETGGRYENDWDLWVFPHPRDEAEPDSPFVTTDLEDAIEHLQPEVPVLLLLDSSSIDNDVQLGFSTVFWNTAWTNGQAPHTLGLLCDPSHPVFKGFPTEAHTDWQWWELIKEARPLIMDPLPKTLRPLIQPIDTWFRARRLGLLFEAEVGNGRLMVCSMDLSGNLGARPAARQFRRGLLDYLDSPAFAPGIQLEIDELRTMISENQRRAANELVV